MANTRGSMRAEDVARMRVHIQSDCGGGRGPSGAVSPLLIEKMDQSAVRLSLLPWKHLPQVEMRVVRVEKKRKRHKETFHI